ncbi:hypothetical protein [Alistipes sp.]|uniref:hypothetical protein n=1 Tax=Alistipes sp. TaxID=1872444 RepID=UPI003AF0240D
MIDLKDYAPQSPEFKLPQNTPFPQVLFEGAEDIEEIRRQLAGRFVTESTKGVRALRLLDEHEQKSIRANYAELLEEVQPKLEERLREVEASCKTAVREARERLQAVTTRIRDLVYQVKRGETEIDLPGEATVRMALCGHYLYYAWVDGKFRLCRTEPIPAEDAQSLFANLETNRQAFHDVLGIDLNESDEPIATPSGAEE